ncbi:unnamed protein product [Auanema sp. JU1783]|nr:unnamed protein product [Auanema sp. JU1783]
MNTTLHPSIKRSAYGHITGSNMFVNSNTLEGSNERGSSSGLYHFKSFIDNLYCHVISVFHPRLIELGRKYFFYVSIIIVRASISLSSEWKTILLCSTWYTISAIGSIVNKVFLQNFPFPLTLSLCHLLCVPFLAYPFLKYWKIEKTHLSKIEFRHLLLPLSIGKALAVGSAYCGLLEVPISYSQAVKASMPFFAVLLSRIILKEKQSYLVYLSLFPIVLGVIIASITEISFSLKGLLFALFSTFTYAILSIVMKKLMKCTGIHPLYLLVLNSELSAVCLMPFWFVSDGIPFWSGSSEIGYDRAAYEMYFLLMCSASLAFMQNVCAFQLIHRLSALSYSVCNATKRITVIFSSLATLHNPVTSFNIFGVSLSVIGVLCYNKAKQVESVHPPYFS